MTSEIATYNFSGDVVTFLGLVGVISTGVIVITVFRRYFNFLLRKWLTQTSPRLNQNSAHLGGFLETLAETKLLADHP
jgi:hypothetical protein